MLDLIVKYNDQWEVLTMKTTSGNLIDECDAAIQLGFFGVKRQACFIQREGVSF